MAETHQRKIHTEKHQIQNSYVPLRYILHVVLIFFYNKDRTAHQNRLLILSNKHLELNKDFIQSTWHNCPYLWLTCIHATKEENKSAMSFFSHILDFEP